MINMPDMFASQFVLCTAVRVDYKTKGIIIIYSSYYIQVCNTGMTQK